MAPELPIQYADPKTPDLKVININNQEQKDSNKQVA